MSNRYCTLLSFGNISFNVGPLCTGLISAWFNWAGPKHSLTLPLALDTSTMLLHHSKTSSTPRGVIITCCSLCSSSWNGFCSTNATDHGSAWYGVLSVFSCKENVPSKQAMPLNTSPNSFSCSALHPWTVFMFVWHSLFCYLSIYRINVYINYVECICVWNVQQCVPITGNYKNWQVFLLFLHSISTLYVSNSVIVVLLYVFNIMWFFTVVTSCSFVTSRNSL